jgi:hypothetical protein
MNVLLSCGKWGSQNSLLCYSRKVAIEEHSPQLRETAGLENNFLCYGTVGIEEYSPQLWEIAE